MDQVIVEDSGPAAPLPVFKISETEHGESSKQSGEAEWMRNKLGKDTNVRLLVKGDMGPKEIGRLIRLLEAQKEVLEDELD